MKPKQVLDGKGVKEALEEMASKIFEGAEDMDNLILVGIITRGVALANRISGIARKRYGVDLKVASLDTTPFRDDIGDRAVEDRSNVPFNITGAEVVLVDDVMSTGRTVRAAMDALISKGRPKSIRVAVLIDRGHRELPISADYVGVQIPTSVRERIRVRLKEIDGGEDGAYVTTR